MASFAFDDGTSDDWSFLWEDISTTSQIEEPSGQTNGSKSFHLEGTLQNSPANGIFVKESCYEEKINHG